MRTRGRQGFLGLILIAIWWPIAWAQLRPLSDYYFFPLWLGYILTVDGLVEWRTGTSLWRRSHRKFVLLFFVSIPFWWLFEWINTYVQNWHYHAAHAAGPIEYIVVASLSFSTVVPAVLEASELVASFRIGDRLLGLGKWRFSARGLIAFHLLGWILLALVIGAPRYAFPFTWLSIFFILEPLNAAVGQRSLSWYAAQGRWSPIWNVMLATLMTGFFWEMWNTRALPKWTYTVPFVDFGHVFEMPVLGYTGYLPFGLELFSVFALIFWLVERRPQDYARVAASVEHGSFDPPAGKSL